MLSLACPLCEGGGRTLQLLSSNPPARLTRRSSPPPSSSPACAVKAPAWNPRRWDSRLIGAVAMYPELTRVVDTPTKRKVKPPCPATAGAPGSRTAAVGMVHWSQESDGSQQHAGSDANESLKCPVRTTVPTHAILEVADPLAPLYPASEPVRGVVAVEAALRIGALDAGVGCGSGEVRKMGSVEGPILVDFDVDTDDKSGQSGGEPDSSFTMGPASATSAQFSGRPSRFAGRERPRLMSAFARGPVRGAARRDRRSRMVGRVFSVYNGPLCRAAEVGGSPPMRRPPPPPAPRDHISHRQVAALAGSHLPKGIAPTGTRLGAAGGAKPAENAFLATAGRIATKTLGAEGPGAKTQAGVDCPDRQERVRAMAPLYLEFMTTLTPHFH